MDKVYLVMEFVEHDVKALLKQMNDSMKKFKIGKHLICCNFEFHCLAQVKTLMQQLLSGCAYMHNEWVIHRDLKTSNLLLTHNNVLKVSAFGRMFNCSVLDW
jgi:cell division cycle 2-like protein